MSEAPTPSAEQLSAGYRPAAGGYDEMAEGGGRPRQHWHHLCGALDRLGPWQLARRSEHIQAMLRDAGVGYNRFDAQEQPPQPWPVDPVPLALSSREWREVELGLQERAELLDLVLQDLYGSRDLIRRGLLPPEVLFAHQGFLRPCAAGPGERVPRLTLYAADLVRDAAGQLRVVGDRTQAPSGAGYALANRAAVSRVLPSLFRESRVHRLTPFFTALRGALLGSVSDVEDERRGVVLTPGPRNETFFEHSYLADRLGFGLVTGPELTVRRGRVFQRSLGRLQPVHVILRRVDEDFCDPLELRPDSYLGVAGLLQSWRLGQVALANPLGCGVLENAALLAFLPGIARHLLGRELRLESVTTWWCGEPQALERALEQLPELLLKPVDRGLGAHRPVLGSELDAAGLARWRAELSARPHRYVAQQALRPGTIPTFVDASLAPRASVLRAFAVADQGGYTVMPGGLTRVAPGADDLVVSSQWGASSKDTWILASEPQKPPTGAWPQPGFGPRPAAVGALTAGAADQLFWLGRYAERSARESRLLVEVLRAWQARQEGLPLPRGLGDALLALLAQVTATRLNAADPAAPSNASPALALSLAQPSQRGTLAAHLAALLRNIEGLRGLLPGPARPAAEELRRVSAKLAGQAAGDDGAAAALGALMLPLAALRDTCDHAMRRDAAWLFQDLGRATEQALGSLALARGVLRQSLEALPRERLLEAALAGAGGLDAHRRGFGERSGAADKLHSLLADTHDPASAGFQFRRIEAQLAELPPTEEASAREMLAEALLEARAALPSAQALAAGENAAVVQALANAERRLRQFAERLEACYFSEGPLPQQLERLPVQETPA